MAILILLHKNVLGEVKVLIQNWNYISSMPRWGDGIDPELKL